jgi:hypothetical protein
MCFSFAMAASGCINVCNYLHPHTTSFRAPAQAAGAHGQALFPTFTDPNHFAQTLTAMLGKPAAGLSQRIVQPDLVNRLAGR